MKKIAITTALIMAGIFALNVQASDETQFLRTVSDYLEVSERYVTLVKQKEAALFFAIEGIVEVHEDRGEQAKAIPQLKKILEKYPDNQTVRNIVHFKLRDLYKETGSVGLALGELEAVIDENR